MIREKARSSILAIFLIVFCLFISLQFREIARVALYYDWLCLDGFFSRGLIENEPSIKIKKNSQMNFDYEWLVNKGPIFIAHRGGNYTETGQNTKTTINNSLNLDINFIEIDFYLDEQKRISCLTDAEFIFDACTIDWLFKKIQEKDFYLIIDLKLNVHDIELYDFFYSSMKMIEGFDKVKSKIIPQAYNLENINILAKLGYNQGPIFTSYRSNVPVDLLSKKVKEFDVEAMAIPFSKNKFLLKEFNQQISYFLFPVKNSKQLEVALAARIKGFYSPFYELKEAIP